MDKKYSDKYSKAAKEQAEKSAFICESCNGKYRKEEAEERGMTCCDRTLKELHQEAFGP